MKKLLYLISLSSLVTLIGCNYTANQARLLIKLNPTYKVISQNSNYYSIQIPAISQTATSNKENATNEYNKLVKKMSTSPLTKKEMEDYYYYSRVKYSILKPDTVRNIIVAFSENLDGVKYEVKYIHHWDFQNLRGFIPFLSYGNMIHLQNQSINRGIEACIYNKMDGVIVDPTLNNYRLIKILK